MIFFPMLWKLLSKQIQCDIKSFKVKENQKREMISLQ